MPHRDIKPQYIRIDAFGQPMLTDFGAARAETQAHSRMAGTFRVVTDGYSPHEFYVTGPAQGPRSDLYALAATLYHVITGAAPVALDGGLFAFFDGMVSPEKLARVLQLASGQIVASSESFEQLDGKPAF